MDGEDGPRQSLAVVRSTAAAVLRNIDCTSERHIGAGLPSPLHQQDIASEGGSDTSCGLQQLRAGRSSGFGDADGALTASISSVKKNLTL